MAIYIIGVWSFKETSTIALYQVKSSSIRRLRKPEENLSSPLYQKPPWYTCAKVRKIGSGVNSTRAVAGNMVDRLRASKGLNIPCYKVAIYSLFLVCELILTEWVDRNNLSRPCRDHSLS